ncbi:MAG: radical SAM protein, partial [Candidatus Margulisiibacteriota bacterium]
PKVRWITWEVTSACNSRCLLCDIWKTKPLQGLLSLEEIKKTFSDPLFKDLSVVLLTGGEPVLRDDLLEIILFIHHKIPKARFTLSTNGILPDKVLKVVSESLQNGVKIDVGVSLDGIGEQHDQIRGTQGNFKKVDHLLHELIKLRDKFGENTSIVIGLTLHPLTIGHVEGVRNYADKLGVHFLAQLYDEGPYYHNVGKFKAGEKMDQDRTAMVNVVKKLCPTFHNQVLLKILKDKIIKFDCFTMRHFFMLRSNGDVMPCLRLSDMRIGNVKVETPTKIWESEEAGKARKMVKECKGCANTWATEWSIQCNFLPFAGLIGKYLMKNLIK